MPLTSAQRVRQRIQDDPRRVDAVYVGSANPYTLPHVNLTSGSAFVPAGGGWSATGAAFDVSGFVTFSAAISGSFRVVYVHSVFSDAVIEDYLSAYGSVPAAALQCAYDLQFDALKRARWGGGDISYDDTEGRHVLCDIISALKAEMNDAAMYDGAFAAWEG